MLGIYQHNSVSRSLQGLSTSDSKIGSAKKAEYHASIFDSPEKAINSGEAQNFYIQFKHRVAETKRSTAALAATSKSAHFF